MSNQNARHQGYKIEEFVCNDLIHQGYAITSQNFTIRGGELDIIASRHELLFVEVKYVSKDADRSHTITSAKVRALSRTIHSYMSAYPSSLPLRACAAFVYEDTGFHIEYFDLLIDGSF